MFLQHIERRIINIKGGTSHPFFGGDKVNEADKIYNKYVLRKQRLLKRKEDLQEQVDTVKKDIKSLDSILQKLEKLMLQREQIDEDIHRIIEQNTEKSSSKSATKEGSGIDEQE